MIKNIKILICIFIAFILIPINVYATSLIRNPILMDTTLSSEIKYGGLKNRSTEELETYKEHYDAMKNLSQEQKNIRIEIEKELNRRKPENVKTVDDVIRYWNEKGTNKDLDTETIENWIKMLNGQIKEYERRIKIMEELPQPLPEIKQKTKEETEKKLEEMVTIKNSIEAQMYNSDLSLFKPNMSGSNKKLYGIVGKIVGTLQIIGSVIAVAVLVIIGIKYMVGSVEEKAKYKETMWPYIIGCIMIFGISNVASIIYKFALNLS